MILPLVLRDLIGRAITTARPREMCGYLLARSDGTLAFRAVENQAVLRTHEFAISGHDDARVRRDAARSDQRIAAIVHSHRGGDLDLSPADRLGAQSSDVPWIVVAYADGEVLYKVHAARK